jgi:formate dehydrogenase iron-sulfur subunit
MSTITKQGKYGFLIDVSYCIDCRACNVSCSVQNEVSMTSTRIWMKGSGVVGEFPNLQSYTAPFHCMHCNDPSCVSACTVGALQRDDDGIVQYDDDRCIGCRYCVYACPFGVPNMDLDERFPLIVKCDMCGERLAEGEQPACAATCPPGAIKFGLRQDMLDEAYRRIDEQPGKYVNHVYGEHENGGTSTFYISPVPFEELDFPIAGETSPAYYNRLVTHGTPTVAGAVALGLTGTYLTINNLKQEAAEEAAEKAAQKTESGNDAVNEEQNHAH